MRHRDVFEEVVAVDHLPPSAEDYPSDVFSDVCEQHYQDAEQQVEYARLRWENDETDPLLAALRRARSDKQRAEETIRRLLAYGREFVRPRPYRLEELAEATGMSISGVRTAYQDSEIAQVAQLIGLRHGSSVEEDQ